MSQAIPPRLLRPGHDAGDRIRLANSASIIETETSSAAEFARWWDELSSNTVFEVERVPFTSLRKWEFHWETGNLVHDTGRFFSVQGLRVRSPGGPGLEWTQPIINQPEVGILGLLVKEFDGVLHCLVQAKAEPGNINAIQVSPTVQATRSNYTGAHGGESVPYLEYFTDSRRAHVLVDVLQSEQGAWFYRKRNRNMVVEVTGPVPVAPGYRWIALGHLRRIAAADNMMNMDLRTVFACIPFEQCSEVLAQHTVDPFQFALARSLALDAGALHTTTEVMSWFTDIKSRDITSAIPMPLRDIRDWHRTDHAIVHDSGKYFSVIAAAVRAGRREVVEWTQPFFEPQSIGLIAFLVKRFSGVLHVLAHARVEPGFLDIVELAPTVQCAPENYADWPAEHRPPFLDAVLRAVPQQIRYDAIQSEEGGRFFRAQNRYVIVEIDREPDIPADYRWMTIGQLTGLLEHSHYLNVQARSLIACLNALW
ncbi:NDP-hexose 2,3-dehydratase family protein [Nocardia sp. NPDC020380]|uniref:NDP-hexose 2,3-dehydratase family protein n=1 Tax=Nocardia sp. NPDC020380 TaxID=3364309 RepID=UPI00378F5509